MQPAINGNANSTAESPGNPRSVTTGNTEAATFSNDATFDHPGRQTSGRRFGPLLGGLFATTLIILTLATAAILGAQEGMLVAGVGSRKSTATPSPVRPSATAVPLAVPSPFSTPLPSPSPTQAFYPGYTPAASCPVPSNWQLVVVQSGETLAQIAGRYKTKESVLQQVNCLQSTALYQGQPIYVPPFAASVPIATSVPFATKKPSCFVRTDWVLYTIKLGDTLSSIAARVDISVNELKRANCLVSDTIYAGNQLRVPFLPPPPLPPPTHTRTPTGLPPTSTGAPPSDTPSGEPPTSTSLPPSDTPLPPSDTPLPPPSDTPRPTTPPKPSDTPIPPEPPPMAPAP